MMLYNDVNYYNEKTDFINNNRNSDIYTSENNREQ